ncbi:hypothetical protein MMC26_004415 [Xylographa opegraphella]|nr:hypothetical protein [Xylographa opegraphella]
MNGTSAPKEQRDRRCDDASQQMANPKIEQEALAEQALPTLRKFLKKWRTSLVAKRNAEASPDCLNESSAGGAQNCIGRRDGGPPRPPIGTPAAGAQGCFPWSILNNVDREEVKMSFVPMAASSALPSVWHGGTVEENITEIGLLSVTKTREGEEKGILFFSL